MKDFFSKKIATTTIPSILQPQEQEEKSFASFPEGAEFGKEALLVIDSEGNLTTEGTVSTGDLQVDGKAFLGSLNLSTGLYVAGNDIIDSSGRIPGLTVDYFTSLDGSAITNVDAHHLGGKSAQSFLRSDEADEANSAIIFNAVPGSVNVGGGPLYINPGSATAGYTLFGVAVNGSQKFKIDAEGDVFVGSNLNLTGNTLTSDGDLVLDPSGGGVKVGTGTPGSIDLGGDDLYVTGDIETDGTLHGTLNPGFTTGSIPFQGLLGLTQDNLSLYWDDANNRLGIGTNSPNSKLQINTATTSNIGLILKTTDDITTNNLLQILASNGTVKGFWGADGRLEINLGTDASNLMLGRTAGNATMTGTNNTLIGRNAGNLLTGGVQNILIGNYTGNALLTGNSNTAVGYYALVNTTGSNNVAIGQGALQSDTGGSTNIALGGQSVFSNLTGQYNIGIGYQAVYSTTSSGNIGIGFQSGYGITSGNNNITIGREAGYNTAGGVNNIFIGYQAGYNETGSNKLYIETSNSTSPLIYGEFDNNIVNINGSLGASANLVGYAGSFFNDGNLDTHQGVFIQGCLDTNPTSTCNFLELRDGDGTILGAIEGNGAGGVTNASSGSDYAELFSGDRSTVSPGDILSLDTAGQVVKAIDSGKVIGVYSTSPVTLGNWKDGWEADNSLVPVGLLGQLRVNVSGEVRKGDPVGISPILPGVGIKATFSQRVIGFALEETNPENPNPTQQILVYVSPTWYQNPSMALEQTLIADTSFSEQISSFLSTNALTTLGDTVITGNLNIGTLKLDGLINSIDAVGTMKIQPLALGDIEFLGGLVKLNKEGDVTIEIANGLKLKDSGKERPECSDDLRGTFWYTLAQEGKTEDMVEICKMVETNKFEWKRLD